MKDNNRMDDFVKEAIDFFDIKILSSKTIKCSSYLKELHDNLFICMFLYDCILKGIEIHKKSLSNRIEEISKQVSPEEIPKIEEHFIRLIENKDLITILAYEFFLNYLLNIIQKVIRINLNLLKGIGEIKYKAYEIVEKIASGPELILKDLQNIFLYGTKEKGNLKTKPGFWVKLLKERLKIDLPDEHILFWEVFHDRRNASSHIEAKDRWKRIKESMKYRDIRLWLYSLLYLAYKIDLEVSRKFSIPVEELEINLKGEPFYEMGKFDL